MSPLLGVVVFPGSNCEHDVAKVLFDLGADVRMLWHRESDLGDVDGVIVPGGFAHGDYLRPGAIARFSPVMSSLRAFAERGGPVVGICNGFQVLTEAGLLPGALMANAGLRFICRTVECEVSSTQSVLTAHATIGSRLFLPINHYEGNYVCDQATLAEIEKGGQIVLRYVDNPNGSVASIAGVANASGNVVGLMPHPERASRTLLGSVDGLGLMGSVVAMAEQFSSGAHEPLARA